MINEKELNNNKTKKKKQLQIIESPRKLHTKVSLHIKVYNPLYNNYSKAKQEKQTKPESKWKGKGKRRGKGIFSPRH